MRQGLGMVSGRIMRQGLEMEGGRDNESGIRDGRRGG